VRLGFIGVGLRGQNHLEMAMYRPDVEIVAICDVNPNAIQIAQEIDRIEKGRKAAVAYQKGDHDFENLVKRTDIDGVVIATPWEWHVPMALESMKQGKYTAVEVSATVTLQESWDLVNMYEKTGISLHDFGKCVLSSGCAGCAEYGASRDVRNPESCAMWLSTRPSGSEIQ
jgi:predicted dehydrogenase